MPIAAIGTTKVGPLRSTTSTWQPEAACQYTNAKKYIFDNINTLSDSPPLFTLVVGGLTAIEISNRIAAAHADDIRLGETMESKTWDKSRRQRESLKYFRDNTTPGWGGKGNEVHMMRRWGKHMRNNGKVHDAKRTGRPTKVPKPTIAKCCYAFLKGYTVVVRGKKVRRGFTSLEACVRASRHTPQVIKAAIESSGITVKALWRAMLRMMPTLPLFKSTGDVKACLSIDVKNKRLRSARQLAKWDVEKLSTVVWIDAKSLYITPEEMEVYSLPTAAEEAVYEDERVPMQKYNNTGHKLHYYAGINALTGLVHFTWVSGTTAYNSGYKTKVISHTVHVTS